MLRTWLLTLAAVLSAGCMSESSWSTSFGGPGKGNGQVDCRSAAHYESDPHVTRGSYTVQLRDGAGVMAAGFPRMYGPGSATDTLTVDGARGRWTGEVDPSDDFSGTGRVEVKCH